MMISAGGEKCGLPSHALRDLEPKHVTPKLNSAIKVGHFEMCVADANRCVNWPESYGFVQAFKFPQRKPAIGPGQ